MTVRFFDLHESGPPKGGEFGTPAILVEKDVDCDECGQRHDLEVCPDCGADIVLGFGLGCGPGYGEWKACEKFCGWSWKRALPHDEA